MVPQCETPLCATNMEVLPSAFTDSELILPKCCPELNMRSKRAAATSPSCSRKRRRVHFGAGADQVHEVESRASLTESTKKQLWLQHDDIQSSVSKIKKSFAKGEADMELPVYAVTLAATYVACCEDSEKEGIPASISPQQLELLGTGRGENRGLETCAVPTMAFQRSQRRRENIQSVVAVHQQLKGVPGEANVLRSLSEELSRPSRKFAQAMGIGDSLSALLEYSAHQAHGASEYFKEGSASTAVSQADTKQIKSVSPRAA